MLITEVSITVQHVNMSGHEYNTIGENHLPLEENWRHTCGRIRLDLKPPSVDQWDPEPVEIIEQCYEKWC